MATINYLTTVQFDFGAIKLVSAECARLGIERPLIVTDKGIRASGLLDRLRENLEPALGFELFDDTPANPTEAAALQAVALYRKVGADGIIAMGGGSSLDLGKAVALLATHAGPFVQYAAVEGGAPKITAAVAPLIAIPTTAGTGSEVGRGSVMVLNDGRKLGFLSPLPAAEGCHLRPRTHLRAASDAHGGHGHGRHRALHRDVPVAAGESAGRSDRHRRIDARHRRTS